MQAYRQFKRSVKSLISIALAHVGIQAIHKVSSLSSLISIALARPLRRISEIPGPTLLSTILDNGVLSSVIVAPWTSEMSAVVTICLDAEVTAFAA